MFTTRKAQLKNKLVQPIQHNFIKKKYVVPKTCFYYAMQQIIYPNIAKCAKVEQNEVKLIVNTTQHNRNSKQQITPCLVRNLIRLFLSYAAIMRFML